MTATRFSNLFGSGTEQTRHLEFPSAEGPTEC